MRCPFCGDTSSQVKDSRPAEDHGVIRRRRSCPACGARFTTFERVQLRELTVIKKNGRRAILDRDKLARSVHIAMRKRPVEPERVERMISGVVRQLESLVRQRYRLTQSARQSWRPSRRSIPSGTSASRQSIGTSRRPSDFETFVQELRPPGDQPAADKEP